MTRTARSLALAVAGAAMAAAALAAAPPAGAAPKITRAALQARLITAIATSEKAAAVIGSSSVFTLTDSTGTFTYTGRTYGKRWTQTIGPKTTIGTGTRSYTTLDRSALAQQYGPDTVAVSLALLKKPGARWLTYSGARLGTLHQYGDVPTLKRAIAMATAWSVRVRPSGTTYTMKLPDQTDTFVLDSRGRIVRLVYRMNVGTYAAAFTYAKPRGISLPAAGLVLGGDLFFKVVAARDQQRTAAQNVGVAADAFAQTHGHPATTVDDIHEALGQPTSPAATYAAVPEGARIGSTRYAGLPPLCVIPSDTTTVVVACV